nr:UDP-glucuronosyltransferase 1-3-like [Leptinotarsa decemlineata]
MSTLWLYVLLCFRYADSAKILGFFSFPSVSHQIIFQSIWKELSLRGHEVTVITPNPLSDTSLKNLKEIDVRSAYEVLSKKNFSGIMGTSTSPLFKVFFIHDMLISITEAEIQQKSVLELMALDENHFDVILVQSLHPLMYFTGAKFRAPIIVSKHCNTHSLSSRVMMSTTWLYFLLCFWFGDSAKILGFFPYPAISHQSPFQALSRELSLRGHEVTAITPNPLNDPTLKNLTEIDVRFVYDILARRNMTVQMGKGFSTYFKVMFLHETILALVDAELQQKNVAKLLTYDESHFDVLLAPAIHPLTYLFAAKFRAPVVGVSSFDIFLEFHDAVGNPTHPIISPEIVYNGFDKELSFVERVKSVLFHIWYRAIYYWHILPEADKVTRKYLGEDVPYLGDVIKNTSMFLVNVNCILHKVRANVPNVIPMSQMHIRKKKPLPKVSNWFGKFCSGYYFCQFDFAGHPNIKVFITQGGVQSLEEAIANEVPVIGLPFISDQSANVKRMMDRGAGLGLDPNTLTKDDLRNAILEVATNSQDLAPGKSTVQKCLAKFKRDKMSTEDDARSAPKRLLPTKLSKKYKKQIKKAKSILLDEPLVGVEKAVWWIEYVLRHKGAPHLRSEAADMSFFEYFMVDVLAFLSICVLLASFIFIYSMRVLVKLGLSISESPKQKSA